MEKQFSSVRQASGSNVSQINAPLRVRQRFAFWFVIALAVCAIAAGAVAQPALFEFTGQHPTDPTNWQKPENWKLNGEPAGRPPGTGPDDRVTIAGFAVSNPASTVTDLILSGSLSGGFLNTWPR